MSIHHQFYFNLAWKKCHVKKLKLILKLWNNQLKWSIFKPEKNVMKATITCSKKTVMTKKKKSSLIVTVVVVVELFERRMVAPAESGEDLGGESGIGCSPGWGDEAPWVVWMLGVTQHSHAGCSLPSPGSTGLSTLKAANLSSLRTLHFKTCLRFNLPRHNVYLRNNEGRGRGACCCWHSVLQEPAAVWGSLWAGFHPSSVSSERSSSKEHTS